MKKLTLGLLLAMATLSLPAITAGAANLDHMICYRMTDPLQISTSVDMIAELQPQFSQQGCKLIKPFEFCVPATKTNVQPAPANPEIIGPPLESDYICYRAMCPKQIEAGDRTVSDQFGSRVQHNYRPFTVCVPARKGPVPCGLSGRRSCGGACPDPAADCVFDKTTKQCTCEPMSCGGVPDSHGMCGGNCPLATERCLPSLSGKKKLCTCQPPPPPPCGINSTAANCGGQCPNPADKCQVDASGKCFCQPAQTPCGLVAGTNACGGACPTATETCVATPSGCVCAPQSCSQNPLNGQCGGPCPTSGDKCLLDAAGVCGCQPPPCGSDPAAGACAGACPAGSTCHVNAASNSCSCN